MPVENILQAFRISEIMKHYKHLILLAVVLFPQILSAQFIAVFPSLASCAKCNLLIERLSSRVTHKPMFIFLPSKLANDSSDIEESFKFKASGIPTIYSDDYCNAVTNRAEGTVAIFNEYGDLKWETALFDFNQQSLDSLALLLKPTAFEYYNSSDNVFRDGTQFSLNILTGKYRVNSSQKQFTLKADTIDVSEIKRKYSSLLKKKIFSYDLSKQDVSYRTKFSGLNHHYQENTELLMCTYYEAYPEGRDTGISSNQFIAKINNGLITDKLLIMPPPELNKTILSNEFIAHENKLYLIVIPTPHEGVPNEQIIGEWKLEKGVYSFTRYLDLKVPPDMYKVEGFNLLNFYASDYPYSVQCKSRFIDNLSNQERTEIFYTGMGSSQDINTDSDSCKLSNEGLSLSKNGKHLYLYTMVGDERYMSIFDSKKLSRISMVKIENVIPDIKNYRFFHLDGKNNRVLVSLGEKNIWALPLNVIDQPNYH